MRWSKQDDVKAFMREISRYPLLNADEEINLGRQIQRMIRIKEAIGDRPTESQLAAFAQEQNQSPAEIRKHLQAGEKARQRMIACNLRLVISIARKFQHREVEFLDLIQEGTLGLSRAAERYNPDLGFRFSTFSYWWIRQAIAKTVAFQSPAMRLPIHVANKIKKMQRLRQEYIDRHGNPPSRKHLAKAMEIDLERLETIINCSRSTVSLDTQIGARMVTDLSDLLEDEKSNLFERLCESNEQELLETAIRELPAQERAVVALRWGLTKDRQVHSITRISDELNITKDSVRRKEQSALDKIKNCLAIV